MHQCMNGGHTVKECQQEDQGLTQERIGIEKALELKSILLSLMSKIKDHAIHGKVFSDSTNAIACINKLGTSHSEFYNHITKQIWQWAEKKKCILQLSIY